MSNFNIPYRQTVERTIAMAVDSVNLNSLYAKNQTSVFDSSTTNFWSMITNFNDTAGDAGFSTNTAFVANEFKTIVSYTGSGKLTNIIGPLAPNSTTTFVVRITKDGDTVTSQAITTGSDNRLVVGAKVSGQPSNTNGAVSGVGNPQDRGFATLPTYSIAVPSQAIQLAEYIEFNESLTVEIMCSQNIAATNQNARAGVLLTDDYGLRA